MSENKLDIINIQGIDCYEQDGVAYLRLENCARGLGFTQMKNGVEYVKWERVNGYLEDFGFLHKWGKDDFIPENIFYRLAMKAKNETAEKFQALVADEIIPSIRKHGAYITPQTAEKILSDPDTIIRLAMEIKANRAQIAALEGTVEVQRQEIEELRPVKQYVDTILASTGTMTITQIAADYGLTAQKLNKVLHEEHIQRKVNGQWVLYQEHEGKGYTKSHTIPITRANGSPDAKIHTKWTQTGRLMIHGILTGHGIVAKMDAQTVMA